MPLLTRPRRASFPTPQALAQSDGFESCTSDMLNDIVFGVAGAAYQVRRPLGANLSALCRQQLIANERRLPLAACLQPPPPAASSVRQCVCGITRSGATHPRPAARTPPPQRVRAQLAAEQPAVGRAAALIDLTCTRLPRHQTQTEGATLVDGRSASVWDTFIKTGGKVRRSRGTAGCDPSA